MKTPEQEVILDVCRQANQALGLLTKLVVSTTHNMAPEDKATVDRVIAEYVEATSIPILCLQSFMHMAGPALQLGQTIATFACAGVSKTHQQMANAPFSEVLAGMRKSADELLQAAAEAKQKEAASNG